MIDSQQRWLEQAARMPVGIGLRSAFYEHILAQRPDVAWFEVLSDNYMNTRGRPLAYLDRVASCYPVALHGVGLSIGSFDPLDVSYVKALRELRERTGARWVSDHIAWTGVGGKHGHDLYPLPFTEECLRHVARRVCQVQDLLEAPLVLENPSTYLQFNGSTLSEAEFIRALVEETGCGLLLDVNNIYVNAHNHGFDAHDYLRKVPLERVMQLHLAGHEAVSGTAPDGRVVRHLVDTHDRRVAAAVWSLFEDAVRLGARAPVLVEWDADIPELSVVQAEALRAEQHIQRALVSVVAGASVPGVVSHPPVASSDRCRHPGLVSGVASTPRGRPSSTSANMPSERSLGALQSWLFERVTRPIPSRCPEQRAREGEDQARVVAGGLLGASGRIEIYRGGYWSRLVECLQDDYPAVAHALGAAAFRELCFDFIEAFPPRSGSLNHYGAPFAVFCAARPGGQHGFVAALAQLEWAVVEAIHADADRWIGPASFSPDGAAGLDLEHAGLEPSPALRVLALSHPAHVYYQAFLGGEGPTPPGPLPSHVAVCRRGDDVWRVPLDAPLTRVLGLLIGGASLGQALSVLPDENPEALVARATALQRAFSEWVACGFFAAITPVA